MAAVPMTAPNPRSSKIEDLGRVGHRREERVWDEEEQA